MKSLFVLLSISIGTAVFAQSTNVIAAAWSAKSSVRQPAADTSMTAQPPAVRDGSHAFDFIYGKWKMPNHRLKKRLAGSHDWADFVTCDEGSPLPGGIGDIDYWKASIHREPSCFRSSVFRLP